jgi:hypothetical protein
MRPLFIATLAARSHAGRKKGKSGPEVPRQGSYCKTASGANSNWSKYKIFLCRARQCRRHLSQLEAEIRCGRNSGIYRLCKPPTHARSWSFCDGERNKDLPSGKCRLMNSFVDKVHLIRPRGSLSYQIKKLNEAEYIEDIKTFKGNYLYTICKLRYRRRG